MRFQYRTFTPARRSAFAMMFAAVVFVSCSSDETTGPSPDTGPKHSGGMVLIESKGKSFEMGSAGGNADEQPVHSVSFTRSFWMDTTEVTQGEFDRVMRAAYPGRPPSCRTSLCPR